MKGSQESLTTVVVKDAANWLTPQEDDSSNVNPKDTSRAGLVSQVNGQAAAANPSTDGSRQESWATPRAGKTTDENPETWAKRQAKGDVATMPLTAQVKTWQTATVSTVAHRQKDGSMIDKLDRQVKNWATPRAEMDSGAHNGIPDTLHSQMKVQAVGKLNPRWVETLMGLPVGWTMPSCKSPVTIEPTNYDSSATESCLPQQSELLGF
jgi:hypothetical protein